MKSSKTGRIISGLLMTTATAVPVVTTAELIAHVSSGGSAFAATQTTSSNGSSSAAGSSASTVSRAGNGVRTVTGPAVQDPFGTVQARVTLNGNRITNVAISTPTGGVSGSINSQAVPMLRQETLQAQSANINLISGATLTSQAYQQSLQAALGSSSSGNSTVSSSGVAAGSSGGAHLSIKGDHTESD